MGVDVMRWMYCSARPDDNILFGWHAADEARRGLLVLWNVYAFFVTYARTAGWHPRGVEAMFSGRSPLARGPLDRWILSRAAGTAALVGEHLADYDARGATIAIETYIDDLSTWYLRRSRRRFSRAEAGRDRDAAFSTLLWALVAVAQIAAPILPFLTESIYQNLVVNRDPEAPDSVHFTRWPAEELAVFRDEDLEAAMATARRAVDLVRTLRSGAGIRVRQPIARLWLALPGGDLVARDALLALIGDEVNVKDIELIGDESELVDRRVKPLLPRIGKRLGAAIPAIMAAARAGEVEYLPDGGVRLAGVTLAADDVEILATPRPGTAVAHDEGLVVVIDTELTAELRAEGDARELSRAVQELRKDAGLELTDRIELWIDGLPAVVADHLDGVLADTLAETVHHGPAPKGASTATVELENGTVGLGLRTVGAG
jgi:isoleucyl-tRNA synthetase